MPSQLAGGSRAAPIPKNAEGEFASASTLLRLARFDSEIGSDESTIRSGPLEPLGLEDNGKLPASTKKEQASVFKVPKALQRETTDATNGYLPSAGPERLSKNERIEKAPASRKPHKQVWEDGEEQTKIKRMKVKGLRDKAAYTGPTRSQNKEKPLEMPAPKRRCKKKSKDEEEGQTKIKQAGITKPGVSKSVEKPKKAAATAKKAKSQVAETFNTLLGTQEENAKAREEFRDLCLEKAIPLRRDWTPCKDTLQDQALSAEITDPPDSMTFVDTPIAVAPPAARFSQLLGDFGFPQNADNSAIRPDISRQESGESLVKRRKIELLNGLPAAPQGEKLKRTKSPKKKPQTITEKATAPFVPTDASAAPSLLQYFNSSAASEALPNGPSDDTKAAAITTMKLPVKRAPKSTTTASKAKKSTLPILLSPESAMSNAKDQVLVFGTSSQLAREESPTFIKNLQQAMEESATVSQESEASIVPAGKFKTSNALAVARPRNLWAVASRDLDGSLLEAETVDLTETPKPPKTRTELAPCLHVTDMVEHQLLQEDQQPSEPRHNMVPGKLELDSTPVLQRQVQETKSAMPKTVAEAALRMRPNNRCPIKNATNTKSNPNQMPNYRGFTDAQLAKEVAAYGFKSIKKRVAMITLLEQCWDAKLSMALQEVEANLNPLQPATISANVEATVHSSPAKKRGRPPKSATASSAIADDPPPKMPRGRPKKDTAATTPPPKRKRKAKSPTKALSEAIVTAEDEIYDSSPPTPSPPQRSSPKSPGQLRLSQPIKACVKAKAVRGEQKKELLFAQMTKAITTFPPTNDIKNLTFHEKILMYEPVVLEDLTAWLNSQGLASVGEDDEVEPALVKKWCEERSVCCLWRENLRGGARGRW